MRLRVSAVQYYLQRISSFDDFKAQVLHYVKTAEEFESEVILFPEFLTTQLLSIGRKDGSSMTIQDLPSFTDQYIAYFKTLASQYKMIIAAGTHVISEGERLLNVAFLFHPDGTISQQPKLHITPSEKKAWNMTEGNSLSVFDTEKGKVALLTCYDIEFPEVVRMVRAKGADLILCPSCTDNEQGFYRVRYCCHARAIENQVYIVNTGTVGSLPNIDFMRANYGQGALITPNDVPFPPRGIMVEGIINADMTVTGDLDLSLLYEMREKGSVRTWQDRRIDLYPSFQD
ncbi:carbon-nitrogen hydrolase family protein [Heliorestis acidaminivorans]|uniref:Carbon-nitrogen hydrolase family protein n=1 Tax=Heliorestis acidaminivorans TaxID=553427 RepID=A0A6I0EYP2_9FIRM|nr:carbon-nitrogen hydrolase family protein [Heliorestis acidaminivorans]KAB2951863.1 carbon-nitrogen hydrolase family protein [Heliorestis acidaminivorans]